MEHAIFEVLERYHLSEFPNAADLPEEDGEPLETSWHRAEINLLIDIIHQAWQGRQDFYVGGNMFIYFSPRQVRNQDYKGPDFFLVKNVDGSYSRPKWVVWEEGGRFPNVIVELLSPSTANEDLTTKKMLYERTFRTPEYFCYDPFDDQLWGWRLSLYGQYEALPFDEQGRLWSEELGAWVGVWDGEFLGEHARWLRFFDEAGNLLPTIAEAARARADEEHARAERAEAEAARLREELERLKKGV
jgi:Uma2 family endonuclease